MGAGSFALFAAKPASATVARALSVKDLVGASRSVCTVMPLASRSEWTEIGGSRRIVTLVRVRVEELVSGAAPSTSELVVRTLGGQVGSIGQIVHGEAELRLGEPSLLFVREVEPDLFAVTAMAQGHYPIINAAKGRILSRSPGLATLIGARDAAVDKLPGRTLAEGVSLVREAARR